MSCQTQSSNDNDDDDNDDDEKTKEKCLCEQVKVGRRIKSTVPKSPTTAHVHGKIAIK